MSKSARKLAQMWANVCAVMHALLRVDSVESSSGQTPKGSMAASQAAHEPRMDSQVLDN